MRRRDERGALGNERQPEHGRGVDVLEEEDVVVVPAAPEDEIEQLGCERALRVDERTLVVERVPRPERAPLVELEVPRAWPFHREAPHGDAVHRVEPGGEFAPPRPVIGRRRRRHFDREIVLQMPGDLPRMRFGAARDVAVSTNDDEEARAIVHAATRSTSCSSRASNAGQVHSAST